MSTDVQTRALRTQIPVRLGRLPWSPISTGKVSHAALALILGAPMMIIGGLAEMVFGLGPERRGLEDIAQALTAADTRDRDRSSPAAAAA